MSASHDTEPGSVASPEERAEQLLTSLEALAAGDFAVRLPEGDKDDPEYERLANAFNLVATRNQNVCAAVAQAAQVIGREGDLAARVLMPDAVGDWENVGAELNTLIEDLVRPTTEVGRIIAAVTEGDLNQKMDLTIGDMPMQGEFLQIGRSVNAMLDQLGSFTEEVTRVAQEVGTEGKLGGHAEVENLEGTWRDLTDSVNLLASSLTDQVRNIAQVTTAVANGDFDQKITVDASGEMLELKNTVNTMVDQMRSFADEVTRIGKEVGTEGKLGGQAEVEDVSGTWRDLIDSVNLLASSLTDQVRNIAQVTTAVANGDFDQKITVDALGEMLELKDTVNTMVDQMRSFSGEVTRIGKEVGTEGKLGGQAEVKDVSGAWRDLIDSVNLLASNLTDQVRNIAQVTTAVANGDLDQKITVEARGEMLELKNTVNTMVDQLSAFAGEVTRVAKEVGTEGKLGGQAEVEGVSGTWRELTNNVNRLASNLTDQVRSIAQVTTAVANGDLDQKITVEAQGELLELKDTVNTMVDQLRSFAGEVTRVAKEVGTEGKLGGQAEVEGVSGTWRELTNNVNRLASNLTDQVRGIAVVTTAVANGDLDQKITVDAQGELLELKDTVNAMVAQLRSFAGEVTRVAKEVGTEGKLGGQAEVEGASGTWKALTDNVNRLASNLTDQVRAIAEVAVAVTEGDFTRQVGVEASGEVAIMTDNLNRMIVTLSETTAKNVEQDWLNSNLARFASLMQGQRDLESFSQLVMSELTPLVGGHHGAFFVAEATEVDNDRPPVRLIASYGYKARKDLSARFAPGEGLVGQSVLEKKAIVLQAPADYIAISSGLGQATPNSIIVIPVVFEDQVMAVIEIASFEIFTETQQTFLDQLTETIGVVLNTIVASMRTEELLTQATIASEQLQSQRDELRSSNEELGEQAKTLKISEEQLQTQQEELRESNEELEHKAVELIEQNTAVELKNAEIERAREDLEQQAQELSISSRYKSEFLANMSHELRTPLNSLLILAKLLRDNRDGSLAPKQVEYARTVYSAGQDLLQLINDILDLSKVEAGKMDLDLNLVDMAATSADIEASFRPLADQKQVSFQITITPDAPAIVTDELRLRQVLKNLLSNAFKFTSAGEIALDIFRAQDVVFHSSALREATEVIGFRVSDSGIGIASEKLGLIFEAFQQADGTTSRQYGGTGLGLSISREIARLLGGEIQVTSVAGQGSQFTLYLPPEVSEHGAESDLFVPRPVLPLPLAATVLAPRIHTPTTSAAGPTIPLTLGAPSAADFSADIPDDREEITATGAHGLLIIEDDQTFAELILEVARECGYKGIVALRGDHGLALAQEFRPHAIILDLQLPVIGGIKIISQLKDNPTTRHIPVIVLSGKDLRHDALSTGAWAYAEKPISREDLASAFGVLREFLARPTRTLLIVEDNEREREAITGLLDGEDVLILAVGSLAEAREALAAEEVDCVVLDMGLPDGSGFELMEDISNSGQLRDIPVVVYTSHDLSSEERARMRLYTESIIVKDDVLSPETLLAATALFLHRPGAGRPLNGKKLSVPLTESTKNTKSTASAEGTAGTTELSGQSILIVDDDARNIFALTAVLESYGANVVYADNGADALIALHANDEVRVVLMDIMMPGMDGYETIRAIRSEERYETLPIIAVTAKAMSGDREKCLEAGASDYTTKPVEPEELTTLIRGWLNR